MASKFKGSSESADEHDGGDRLGSRRRQARGEARIEQIVKAAETVFAEIGYERATTNAIAAQAGVSPGTLYQFFRSKQEIAGEIAARYADRLEQTERRVIGDAAAALELDSLVESLVDAYVAFHRAAPAFGALMHAADAAPELATRVEGMDEERVHRIAQLFESHAGTGRPRARGPAERFVLTARVCHSVFKGMLPMTSQSGASGNRATRELKQLLLGYVHSAIGSERTDHLTGD